MGIVKRAWWWILDLLYPQTCSGCDAPGVALCGRCREALVIGDDELTVDEFRVFVACERSQLLRKILHQYKYRYSEELAFELANLLSQRMGRLDVGRIFLTPVPLHWKRERERGFNQSRMLSKLVSQKLQIPWRDFLVRCHPTQVQATLKRAERIRNVRNAFAINPASLHDIPDCVYILDDIITSGSTFLECAKVLKAAGVKQVYGIMLSHGL